MAKAKGLLVKVVGDGTGFAARIKALRADAVEVEPILSVPAGQAPGMGAAPGQGATWMKVSTDGGDKGWDEAHALVGGANGFAADGASGVLAVEPDIAQQWDYRGPAGSVTGMAASAHPVCAFDDQDGSGNKAVNAGVVGWNASPNFSQFAAARAQVGAKQNDILIAHLDTGFDAAHRTLPSGIQLALQRNFVSGQPVNDASDRAPAGSPIANRGHGTGTLSLLAGNKLTGNSPGWPGFTDFVGGAPGVRVIPVRIADWVVRLTTSSMVQGFDYARASGTHVLSMSMGGLSSSALVDAVNLGYESGMVMVTAAGNNFAGAPTPKSIVFPARYKRVLAACGVMADGRAYAGLKTGTMQGNYGPAEKMKYALGAYTPNVPWAEIDCPNVVDMDGAGTSAATPQVAAAAALWLAEHWATVKNYPEPWMRVEAVRRALFDSASKSTQKMNQAETLEKIGQGVVRAFDALARAPVAAGQLTKLPPAQDSWSWLDFLTGGGVSFAVGTGTAAQRRRMFALELTQMAQRVREIDEAIGYPEDEPSKITAAMRNRYLEAALDLGNPSKPLKAYLETLLSRPGARPISARKAGAKPIKRAVRPPPAPNRRLRVFALDPSVAKNLNSVSVHEVTLTVPWDDQPNTKDPLKPGPIGEYLEVIDIDPASGLAYDPVDLNDKTLLAQDGLPPSEGNPKFHQQMVYAVAMTTIGNFERALGRQALWAPQYTDAEKDGKTELQVHEVPRLRIYPHALRTNNAYYSPDKKALLFGYFAAESKPGDTTTPGSTVFSCLSSDIIAHEMSHALLDGLHRRYQESSNADVPAFHEGFADIVALFQHFMMRELVSFEIAKTHGQLGTANLVQGIAKQFGEGNGRSGPLRDYAGAGMGDLNYETTMKSHARGSILVFAVYEAFQAILSRRTQDLVTLATGGTGVLPEGAMHPDLVRRLTDETIATAQRVLTMCIRALDYCPAVDITFGEYLRAIVTADIDVTPQDRSFYRVAFMESFRKWKLLPRDVRTVSEETLAWNSLYHNIQPGQKEWMKELCTEIDLGLNKVLTRSQIFDLDKKNRWVLFGKLGAAFAADPSLHKQFGLTQGVPRYKANGEMMRGPRRSGTTFDVFSVRPTRRVDIDGSFRTEVIAVIQQRVPVTLDGKVQLKGTDGDTPFFWFRGGATVIIDPREGRQEIRYSIIKNTSSKSRLERQLQNMLGNPAMPLRSLYFGDDSSEPFAMLHSERED